MEGQSYCSYYTYTAVQPSMVDSSNAFTHNMEPVVADLDSSPLVVEAHNTHTTEGSCASNHHNSERNTTDMASAGAKAVAMAMAVPSRNSESLGRRPGERGQSPC